MSEYSGVPEYVFHTSIAIDYKQNEQRAELRNDCTVQRQKQWRQYQQTTLQTSTPSCHLDDLHLPLPHKIAIYSKVRKPNNNRHSK